MPQLSIVYSALRKWSSSREVRAICSSLPACGPGPTGAPGTPPEAKGGEPPPKGHQPRPRPPVGVSRVRLPEVPLSPPAARCSAPSVRAFAGRSGRLCRSARYAPVPQLRFTRTLPVSPPGCCPRLARHMLLLFPHLARILLACAWSSPANILNHLHGTAPWPSWQCRRGAPAGAWALAAPRCRSCTPYSL